MRWLIYILGCGLISTAILSAQTANVPPPAGTIVSHRPLSDAADMLERRFGWLITYEDPLWQFEGETLDLTPSRCPEVMRTPAPRLGQLAFEKVLSNAGPNPDRDLLVADMVRAHNESRNPGVFRMISDGDRCHIVPKSVKGKNGELAPTQPLLDTPIYVSLPESGPSVAVRHILDEIERARGVRVVSELSWEFDRAVFGSRKMKVTATGNTARSFLTKIFKEANRPLAWHLLCQPAAADQPGFCVFNLQTVRAQRALPGPGF